MLASRVTLLTMPALASSPQTFNKPAFEKLLPDPLPAPHQRPYTLLIDLEDMLVHSAWDVSNECGT